MSETVAGQAGSHAETQRKVVRWLIREIMGVVITGVALFWSADTLRWGWGWALVGVYAAWVAANAILLIPANPELLAQRVGRPVGTKTWDTALMSVVGLLTLAQQIVAGLDYRYGWSPDLPTWLHVAGLMLAVAGNGLVTWSMVANAYFSLMVRIQGERGHTVATSGPYRYVRHPGYVGAILFYLSAPVLLGSLWSLILGGLAALLMVIRTSLEDRTLQAELEGYPDYSRKTRYRLLPGVW